MLFIISNKFLQIYSTISLAKECVGPYNSIAVASFKTFDGEMKDLLIVSSDTFPWPDVYITGQSQQPLLKNW